MSVTYTGKIHSLIPGSRAITAVDTDGNPVEATVAYVGVEIVNESGHGTTTLHLSAAVAKSLGLQVGDEVTHSITKVGV